MIGLLRPAASAPPAPTTFEYRAKWICNTNTIQGVPGFGTLNVTAAEDIGLVDGEYKTDINVHNPSHSTGLTVLKEFRVSTAEAAPGQKQSLGPVAFAQTDLAADGAFFITCQDIFTVFQNARITLCPIKITVLPSCGVKGFVILDQLTAGATTGTGFSSPNSLDVFGEYSTQSYVPTNALPTNLNCFFGNSPSGCNSTGTSLDVVPIAASPFVP